MAYNRLTDRAGNIRSRVYNFVRGDRSSITIREHSLGHLQGEVGPHFNVEVRPAGGGPRQPLVGGATMSSSGLEPRDHEAVYLVQSGVVAWESPDPIADWTSKTVTVCAAEKTLLVTLLRKTLSAELGQRKFVWRCHVNAIPSSQGVVQRRRFGAALQADVPGFTGTIVKFGRDVAVSIAAAACIDDVELAYLSAYKQTVLIATRDESIRPAMIADLLMTMTLPIGGDAIAAIRKGWAMCSLIRVLEEENQCVFQVVGDVSTSASIARVLDEIGLSQVLDRVTASKAIGVIPKSDV